MNSIECSRIVGVVVVVSNNTDSKSHFLFQPSVMPSSVSRLFEADYKQTAPSWPGLDMNNKPSWIAEVFVR